eukprot:456279_1
MTSGKGIRRGIFDENKQFEFNFGYVTTHVGIVNFISFIGLGILGVFGALTLLAWRNSPMRAEFFALALVGQRLSDLLTDAAFMFQLKGKYLSIFGFGEDNDGVFYLAVALLVFVAVLNAAAAVFLFYKEKKRRKVQMYINSNYYYLLFIFMVAMSNVGALTVLWSFVFGKDLFSLDVSNSSKQLALRLGLYTGLLEDVPQFLLQIIALARFKGIQVTTILSLFTSCLGILYAAVRSVIHATVGESEDDHPDQSQNVKRSNGQDDATKEVELEVSGSAGEKVDGNLSPVDENDEHSDCLLDPRAYTYDSETERASPTLSV